MLLLLLLDEGSSWNTCLFYNWNKIRCPVVLPDPVPLTKRGGEEHRWPRTARQAVFSPAGLRFCMTLSKCSPCTVPQFPLLSHFEADSQDSGV